MPPVSAAIKPPPQREDSSLPITVFYYYKGSLI